MASGRMDFEVGGRDEAAPLRLLARLPVSKYVGGKYGAANWNEGLHSMLRGKLNGQVCRTKGCAKSVDMPVNLLALVFCAKLKLNTTHH